MDRVVLFEIPDAELVSRMSGRRTCLKCGAMFHVDTMRPKQSGICDVCGSQLVHRDDDRAEVIQKRLAVYHQQTAPLAGFYKNQNKLRSLDARMAPEAVTQALSQVLA